MRGSVQENRTPGESRRVRLPTRSCLSAAPGAKAYSSSNFFCILFLLKRVFFLVLFFPVLIHPGPGPTPGVKTCFQKGQISMR